MGFNLAHSFKTLNSHLPGSKVELSWQKGMAYQKYLVLGGWEEQGDSAREEGTTDQKYLLPKITLP